jgi:hypothetical protein
MIFFVLVFCSDQTYIGQIIRLLSVFNFVLEFADLFKFFLHLAVTQLTQNLIPHQLNQHQVRHHVDRVNGEWDSMSTESTRNGEVFVNVGAFCVDSVDVESHSTLTQLKWSLTLCWISVLKMNQAKTGIHNQLWRLLRARFLEKLTEKCSNEANVNKKMLKVCM